MDASVVSDGSGAIDCSHVFFRERGHPSIMVMPPEAV